MEWELKMPQYGRRLGEFDGEEEIGGICGGGEGSAVVPDCSVDLKLGGIDGFAGSGSFGWLPRRPAGDTAAAAMVLSPPAAFGSPAKRARVGCYAGRGACCLVDGCTADLGKCREYHRRHKVCETHSKTPVVLVGGKEQRFCQQCSRFHSLMEFDEVKRSCRKRLDSHNRRRRKPPTGAINSGAIYLNRQGSRFPSYRPIFQPVAAEPNWASMLWAREEALTTHSQRLQWFPVSQDDSDSVLGTRTPAEVPCGLPPLPNPAITSGNGSGKLFCSRILDRVLHSECALPLLSMPARASEEEDDDANPTAALASGVSMGHAVVPSLRFGYGRHSSSLASNNSFSSAGLSCSAADDSGGRVGAIFVSDAHDPEIQCADLFHIGVEGSSDEAPHTIPFYGQ